jgi:hypothetical protein
MIRKSILVFYSCSILLSRAERVVEYVDAEVDDILPEGYISLIQVAVQPGVYQVSPDTLHLHSGVNRSSPHHGPVEGLPSQVSLLALHVPYDRIAKNVTYHNALEQFMTFPQRRPREFNVMLATCKTWLADMIVQFLSRPPYHGQNGSSWTFDVRRSLAFAVFGFLYIGLAQWFLYVTVLTWLFPEALVFANAPWSMKLTDTDGQLDMLGQVIVDNLIFNVFIYFPAFYMIKGFVQGRGSVVNRIHESLVNYSKNMWQDNLRSCGVWFIADFFVFACPMYMRMPLEHAVSFGWTMFMSLTRGAVPETPAANKEAIAHLQGKTGKPEMVA